MVMQLYIEELCDSPIQLIVFVKQAYLVRIEAI